MMRIFVLLFLFFASCSSEKPQQTFQDKIVMCGVCKDVEKGLPFTIEALEEIGSRFQDYHIFIYENNSSDQTPSLLRAWSQRNPKVTITSEVLSMEKLLREMPAYTIENTPFRTQLIAKARNHVLSQALDPQWDDYRYVMMVDMDFTKKWDIQGILSSFNQTVEWDALLANGVNGRGRTYDRYALRTQKFPLGPELLGEGWWKEVIKAYLCDRVERGLKPVYSAFGGLGIYKREALKGLSYAGVVTRDLEQVVRSFIAKNPTHPQVLKYLNRDDTALTTHLLTPEGLKWIWNSGGIGYPVCCEHVTLHASMIVQGHDKIFINPRMKMYY